MEYIIGGLVVVAIIFALNARAAKNRVRNSDPLQYELMWGLVNRSTNQISDSDLDGIIEAVNLKAQGSPHSVGDKIGDRIIHAAFLAKLHINDPDTLRDVQRLAKEKYIEQ